MQISATTAIKDIDIGQMAEYKNGILNPATKQGDGYFDLKGSFATEGMPLSLHTAVKMSVDGSAFTTIFVDPNAHVTVEKMELQPQNEVRYVLDLYNFLLLRMWTYNGKYGAREF